MSEASRPVLCIGALSADTTLLLDAAGRPATSNPAQRTLSSGGVAHNVAWNLVQLGFPAQLLSVAGDDSEGRALLSSAAAHGIDVSICGLLSGQRSASYTAILQGDGELLIAASDMRICSHLDTQCLHDHHPILERAACIFADANLPAATLEALRLHCAASGQPLYLDTVSVAKATRLPAAMTGVTIVFANRDEAVALTGRSAGDDTSELARAIVARGAGGAVVTNGAAGCWWASQTQHGHIPAAPAAVRDVGGGGDALIAATLAGGLLQRSLSDSLVIGQRAAALAVSVPGTLCDKLTLAAVLREPSNNHTKASI